jgi:hypothetical protein
VLVARTTLPGGLTLQLPGHFGSAVAWDGRKPSRGCRRNRPHRRPASIRETCSTRHDQRSANARRRQEVIIRGLFPERL